MADARFNCIAIFDAVPDGELNTARRLKEELLDVRLAVPEGTRLEVRYFRITSVIDIKAAFVSLAAETRLNGLIPWIHIDGHGCLDESGFVAAEGEFCSWISLREFLTPLNILTKLNVFVLLATCCGGSFARAIRTNDRAPLLALIGPQKSITAGAADVDFKNFYKTFFQKNSIREALDALRASGSEYYITTATTFFLDVWRQYKQNECSEERLEERAVALRAQMVGGGLPVIPSVSDIKRQLTEVEPKTFEHARDTYFMNDLYPDHLDRFPMTFEEAERFAAAEAANGR